MHTLHLLRHAKSSWADEGLADHDRPLAPRGVKNAKQMAEHLGTLEIAPDLVLCSTALRTRQTLDLVAPALGDAPIELSDDLYEASLADVLERLRRLPEPLGTVLVIAHNPGLEDLALHLAAPGPIRDEPAVKFPTGALASLEIGQGSWADLRAGGAELVSFTVPRSLR
jgi:phosphohistidine phosphatase